MKRSHWCAGFSSSLFLLSAAPALAGAPYTPVPVGGGVFVPGAGVMAPDEVFGKEYSHSFDQKFDGTAAPEQVVAWDGLGGTADGLNFSGSRPTNLPREQQIDAIANVGDFMFEDLRKDRAHLVFSHDDVIWTGAAWGPAPSLGPVTLSNGDTIGGSAEVSIEKSGVFNGAEIQELWAAAAEVNSAPVPVDVDGLEVWGPEPAFTADTNKYSLEDDVTAGGGTSVWSYDSGSGSSIAYISHATIVSAVESLLGAVPDIAFNRHDKSYRDAINVDALMVHDADGEGLQFGGVGDAIIFSINQIVDPGDIDGYYATGSELFVLEATAAGLLPSFLAHGLHVWDHTYTLASLRVPIGADQVGYIDINAIEAIGETVVPEPASLALLAAGLALLGRRGRRPA